MKTFIILVSLALTACSQTETPANLIINNPIEKMDTLYLMKKRILLESSPILFKQPTSTSGLSELWNIYHSEWKSEDGWLVGENRGNWPGMIILKQDFPGNVLVEFEAQTVLPSSHDINVMWNGEWLAERDQRGKAYVAGLQGWWTGKVGIEKSNDYKFTVGTPLLDFIPGKLYKIQAGSIDGHCFIFADGKLLLEATDPDPIDNQKYTKVGFETYCSKIRIRNIIIRQIHWEPFLLNYEAEF